MHVFFDEHAEGSSGYSTRYYLDAINRAGRPQEVKDQLLADLMDAFVNRTGVSRDQISGRLGEIPAAWVMEGRPSPA